MPNSDINWETTGIILGLVSAIFTAGLWISNKIFKFGKISQRLTAVEDDIEQVSKDVNAARADLTKRIDEVLLTVVQRQVSVAHSPRQLNDEGERILNGSGIKQIIDENYEQILSDVRAKQPENAYQAEQDIIDTVQGLAGDDQLRSRLEKGAFQSGVLTGVVLYVGGIYIRDKMLSELGMSPADIDDHAPGTNSTI